MIRLDLEHGSREWVMARLGIPTGSSFDRILTPKTRKPSSQAVVYRNQLLAEWVLGYPIDWGGQSAFMERGSRMEPEARAWYEMTRGVDVELAGFVLRDDRMVGGSPDGLVGDDGILEIKCPAIHTHIGYMLGDGPDYTAQVQGYLYLTGRAWADVLSYHPELPPVVVRVERDEGLIAPLGAVLDAFVANLSECRGRLAPYRSAPMERAA